MSDLCVYGKEGNCRECDRQDLTCHPKYNEGVAKWYCPDCGAESKEKHYLRHNGFVPVYVCESCLEREACLRQRSEEE